MQSNSVCWCGNQNLQPFSADYLRCDACETLVVANMPPPDKLLVQDDESDYYGKHYFDTVAAAHGLPALDTRARADLPERCIHWLRGLLRYCSPPARILELGSSHGGFVAMMRWAGFEATGLDLSPEIVAEARRRFQVPILEGPIEAQNIEPASLDGVVLMDVLEHLGDPKGTLLKCLGLLKRNGIFFLQTPQYREGKSFEQMQADDDPFLKMLTPDQHLYLFSKSSVKRLFKEIGVKQLCFEPAMFQQYDMALVSSRSPLKAAEQDEAMHALETSSSGRLILALNDLNLQFQDLAALHQTSEADSTARLANVQTLESLLAEQEAAHATHVAAQAVGIEEMKAATEELREQLRQRDTQIENLAALFEDSNADRVLRFQDVAKLEQLLAEQQAAHSANLEAQAKGIEEMKAASSELRVQLALRDEQLERMTALYQESEADAAARLANVATLEKLVADQEAAHSAYAAGQTVGIEELKAAADSLRVQLELRDGQLASMTALYKESEADGAVRLANVATLERLLAEQDAAHSASLAAQENGIAEIQAFADGLRTQLELRDSQLASMTALYKESEADGAVRLANAATLERLLAEQQVAHAAHLAAQENGIAEIQAFADGLRTQLGVRDSQLASMTVLYKESEADGAVRLANAATLERLLAEQQVAHAAHLAAQENGIAEIQAFADGLRTQLELRDSQLASIAALYKESEADGALRLADIATLERLLAEQQVAHAAHLAAQENGIAEIQAFADGLRTQLELRDSQLASVTVLYKESEADGAARLANIATLEKLLAEQQVAHSARLAAQERGIAEIQADSSNLRVQLALRDVQLESMTALYKDSEANSAARLANVATLERLLAEQQAAHAMHVAAQEAGIKQIVTAYEELRIQLGLRDGQLETMTALYKKSEESGAARAIEIQKLASSYTDSEARSAARQDKLVKLEKLFTQKAASYSTQLLAQTKLIDSIKVSRNAVRAELTEREATIKVREGQLQLLSGNMRDLAQSMERARHQHASETGALTASCQDFQRETSAQRANIESQKLRIDKLEKLLDRMQKSYVFRLMRGFGMWEWLDPDAKQPASPSSAADPKLRKVLVDLTPVLPGGGNGGAKVMTVELIRRLGQMAPDCTFTLLTAESSHHELAALDSPNIRRLCIAELESGLAALGNPARSAKDSIPRRLDADLLFCPFTAPFYFDPGVPTVSVIYDLQYAYYPQFFDASEIHERDQNTRKAVSVASAVVCISDHVRASVLGKMAIAPERVETVYISLPRRLGDPSPSECETALKGLALTAGKFLIYPANFWPHKNHEVLLTAFGIYYAEHPGADLKLVLTGSDGPRKGYLKEAVDRMGLSDSILFPGYLSEEDLRGLLHSCLALIFPSLFEGFGMPLLEAMAYGRPILCSNTTSLPEVGGDAAIYFDPRVPAEIAGAIARIVNDEDLQKSLGARSTRRLASFGGPEEMAASYLKILNKAVQNPAETPAGVYGVFGDGWAGEQFTVAYGRGAVPRKIHIVLATPEWIFSPSLTIRVESIGAESRSYVLPRGEVLSVEHDLGETAGSVEVFCSPSFQPNLHGMGEDSRSLTCQLKSYEIIRDNGLPETAGATGQAHKISVVTPSYNQGRFIERTIESVLSQQFPGSLEYMVMDGGSTDETVSVLRQYNGRLSWVSEKDGGQSDAVNKGLAQATGDLIGWLNSDDIYYPGAFSAIVEAFDADPSLDLIFGDANHIDEHDGIIDAYPTEDHDLSRLLDNCYICQPAVFFRKSVVDRFGPLVNNLNYCMDYEYWVRLAVAGAKFGRIRTLLAGSRMYAQNKTLGSRVRVHAEINDMLRKRARRVPDRWISNYAHVVLDESGVPRSAPIKFPLLVSFLCIYSALKWNHRVSSEMAGNARSWVGGALREAWKRVTGK